MTGVGGREITGVGGRGNDWSRRKEMTGVGGRE